MATKRQSPMGLFKGASRLLRKSQTTAPCPSGASVLYAWDMITDALTWGPAAAEALRLSPRDLPKTGHAFAQLIEPGCGLARHEAIAVSKSSNKAYETRYALRLESDRVVMVEDTGCWLPDPQGRPAFARGQLRVDSASGARDLLPAVLKERSVLLCGIQDAINEAVRVSQTCTLIVGAFDQDASDEMAEVARRLRPMMRRHDLFAALGPNRFALALACCPATDAASAMRRLTGLLQGHAVELSLHLGAACAPDHTFKATKLLRFAEQALAAATDRGEGSALYKSRSAKPAPAAEQAPFDWVAALNGRSLTLACRSMVDAQTRAPMLAHACAAILGADGQTIPLGPAPELQEVNLPLLVDGRMLELAAEHLIRNPDQRLALPVSGKTLQDAEWLSILAAHLGARPGIEARLMLEIPEISVAECRRNLGRLHAMKALGVGIALTGYGAGHVPSAQLQVLPIDMLKIDGVFIQPLKRSTDDRLHVRTLVDRAQHIGIATAAEWVDDEATARLLTAWGVNYLQGGLFGEPKALMQPSSLQALLKRA